MCKSHWSGKYRSRSSGQGACRVRTLKRSTIQGFLVIGLIVGKISNVDVKCVKVTGAQNIAQGHQVKAFAKSLHLGETVCEVWWL